MSNIMKHRIVDSDESDFSDHEREVARLKRQTEEERERKREVQEEHVNNTRGL
eukprot:UN00054